MQVLKLNLQRYVYQVLYSFVVPCCGISKSALALNVPFGMRIRQLRDVGDSIKVIAVVTVYLVVVISKTRGIISCLSYIPNNLKL